MNLQRLHHIINLTTIPLRNGPVIQTEDVGPVQIVHINPMPHESEAKPSLDKVDLHFITVGVNAAMAGRYKSELIELMKSYPDQTELQSGPSYITVAATIGSQTKALQLFALGHTLKLWEVITPKTHHMEGEAAERMARQGGIWMTGFREP